MIMYEMLTDAQNTIKYLKQAEILNKKANNLWLKERVFNGLCFANKDIGNMNTALDYARKALEVSYQTGEKTGICTSLDQMVYIFNRMTERDSCLFYAKKMIPYIKHANTKEQARLWLGPAVAYLNKDSLAPAKHYTNKSLNAGETAPAYYALGAIYMKEGKPDEAWKLLSKALDNDDPEIRAGIMSWMSEVKKEQGEYKAAVELADSAKAIRDSLQRLREAENALKLQALMEQEDTERQSRRNLTIGLTSIIVFAGLIILRLKFRHTMWENATKNRLDESELLPDMGVSEADVPRVMCMTAGAVRTMRYRLRKKAGTQTDASEKQSQVKN